MDPELLDAARDAHICAQTCPGPVQDRMRRPVRKSLRPRGHVTQRTGAPRPPGGPPRPRHIPTAPLARPASLMTRSMSAHVLPSTLPQQLLVVIVGVQRQCDGGDGGGGGGGGGGGVL